MELTTNSRIEQKEWQHIRETAKVILTTRAILVSKDNRGDDWVYVQSADRTKRGIGIVPELPGGKVDKGETVLEGLLKEVREEAGLTIETIKTNDELNELEVGSLMYQFPDKPDCYGEVHIFAVVVDQDAYTQIQPEGLNEDKIVGGSWVRLEELATQLKETTMSNIGYADIDWDKLKKLAQDTIH